MTYDVLIQPLARGTYQATVLGWPDLNVVGDSEIAVVERIKKELQTRLAKSKILHLEIEDSVAAKTHSDHPWTPFLGMWQEDQSFDDFLAKMEAYRREVDEAPTI